MSLRELMAESMKHDMEYRAGSVGFAAIGIPDASAHWYCKCGQWTYPAKPMPARRTGNNLIEAERSHTRHATA